MDVAHTTNNLGELYRAKRQFKKAEEVIQRSITLAEKEPGSPNAELAAMFSNLGRLYTDMKLYDEAEYQYQRSLSILDKAQFVLPSQVVHTLHGLSKTYLRKGEPALAEQSLAR